MEQVKIPGGAIPSVGFGTYGMAGQELVRLISAALQGGFRHIDTGQIYRNEAEVGEGICLSGISRQDVFITTKVWVSNYAPGAFAASVEESLRRLRTDYIDLLLLHWPNATVPLADQIGGLNAVVAAGKVRHIGVSNFNRALLAESVRLSAAPIATNQFEYHPYLNQQLLIEACRAHRVPVTAYCGMAVGRVFDEPLLKDIAATHRKSVAQIVLRWLLQQDDVIALSRTSNADRIASNIQLFDFALSPTEMASIHGLARSGSRIVDPPGLAPLWDTMPEAAHATL